MQTQSRLTITYINGALFSKWNYNSVLPFTHLFTSNLINIGKEWNYNGLILNYVSMYTDVFARAIQI